METRANHILIGFMSLSILTAAILFTLWLSKSSSNKQYDLYDIVFSEAVSGLNKGGMVEFNGIRIGEVISLSFDEQDATKVIARVKVDSSAPIRKDTEAKLMSAGITGLSVIRLSSGNQPNSQLLQREDQSVPIIFASPSPLSKLMTNGEDMLTTVNQLLLQSRQLLSEENMHNIKQILVNIEKTTALMANQKDNVDQLTQQLIQVSEQTKTALAAATQLMSTSEQIVKHQGVDMIEQGKITLEQAQKSLLAAETTLNRLQHTVEHNQTNIDASLSGMTELGPTLVELKQTLASIKMVSQQLEQNPSAYLLNAGKIQEFQP